MTLEEDIKVILGAYRSSVYHMEERVKRWHLSEDIAELKRCKKELARVEREMSTLTGKGAERRIQEKPQEAAHRNTTATRQAMTLWTKILKTRN